uniref:Glycosyl transferase family 2 n=1 Tax=Tetraselmis sp. GSL018 TaxID=582737 RepID=A0A061RDE2_9CHLO
MQLCRSLPPAPLPLQGMHAPFGSPSPLKRECSRLPGFMPAAAHHCSRRPSIRFPSLMSEAMDRASRAGRESTWGCFETIRFDAEGWSYRVIEQGARLRTRLLGLPYGDQGLFVRADVFAEMGGYGNMPLLEDADLAVRWLRRRSPMAVARAPVGTSARRYRLMGPWRTCLMNLCIMAGWAAGVPVPLLAGAYHGTGVRRGPPEAGAPRSDSGGTRG